MKNQIFAVGKKCGQTVLVFLCSLCVLCGLFLLSGLIPKEAVREHVLQSARMMEAQGEKYEWIPGKPWTCMDNYADAGWLNILYSFHSERPWQTMLESPIYVDFSSEEESLTHSLVMRVEQDLNANTVYDRYWHGSVMILRPLLVFMTMEQLHWFMAAVLFILFLCVCVLMWKRGLIPAAVIMIVLAVPCGLLYVPFCAEYWSPWLLSLMFMIYVLVRKPGIWEGSLLMLISGCCTAYFDFLTTETVTFGLPFLLLLLLWQKEDQEKNAAAYLYVMIRSGIFWIMGYAASLLVKWTGSSVLLGENRIRFALTKAAYWEGGSEDRMISRTEGIFDNIRMMAPFRGITDDLNLLLVLLALVIILYCFVFLFRKEKAPAVCPAILLTSCILVLRFLVLSIHASYHSFFTYRALYLTAVAAAVYIAEKADWRMVRKKIFLLV